MSFFLQQNVIDVFVLINISITFVFLTKNFIMEISFNNSNLYLKGKGRDINGNSIIKLSFATGRAFSIQTNQPGLFETEKILRDYSLKKLSKTQLDKIEKAVINYIKKFGSANQKKKLLVYSKKKKTSSVSNLKKQANDRTKKALKEANQISNFISKWQSKNEYKRSELESYNAKFRKDFTAFCKKNKISNSERDWYLKK